MNAAIQFKMFAGILLALAAGSLFAGWNPDTRQYDHNGYVSLKENAGESGTTASFEAGTNWGDGNAPVKGKSYFVPASSSLRMLNTCKTPFKGDVLATAGGSTWQGSTASVPVYHLLSGASFTIYNTSQSFTNGFWTLYPTDATKPVHMDLSQNGTYNRLDLKDISLNGDADTTLQIKGCNNSNTWCELHLLGTTDFSGFFGTLSLLMQKPSTQYFRFFPPTSGTFELPGTLDLGANDVLEATNATNLAGSPLTIGNLTLAAGAKIELELKNDTVRQLTVTGSFTHADTKAQLNVPSRRTKEDLNGTGSVALLTTIEPVSVTPFRMFVPDDWGDAPRFALSDFALDDSYACFNCGLPTASWSVTREAGYDNLTLGIKGIVRKNNTNGGSNTDSALTNTLYWSDGKVPHAGWDYFANSSISVPQNFTNEWIFGGDSLTLGAKTTATGSLQFRSSSKKTILSIPRLNLESGVYVISYTVNDNILAAPKIVTYAGTLGDVRFEAYNNTRLIVDGEISGDGNIFYHMHGNKTYEAEHGKFGCGYITLTGLNTNFIGKVKLGCLDYTKPSSNGYVAREDERIQVKIGDGRALGGELSAFTYDGIRIRDWGLIDITNTTEFAAANRGFFVDWMGAIGVASGKTVTVRAPFTFGGKLQKQGKGALVFGGTAPRFAVGSTDNYTLQDTPVAGTNALYVKEGAVGVAACDALNGVALTFAKDAGLTVDYAATGDLQTYGLRDTDWATPISWNADVETIPVEVANAPADATDVRTLGVLTVPADQADAILAKLRFVKRRGIAGRFRKSVNGESATISLDAGKFGLTVFFR